MLISFKLYEFLSITSRTWGYFGFYPNTRLTPIGIRVEFYACFNIATPRLIMLKNINFVNIFVY